MARTYYIFFYKHFWCWFCTASSLNNPQSCLGCQQNPLSINSKKGHYYRFTLAYYFFKYVIGIFDDTHFQTCIPMCQDVDSNYHLFIYTILYKAYNGGLVRIQLHWWGDCFWPFSCTYKRKPIENFFWISKYFFDCTKTRKIAKINFSYFPLLDFSVLNLAFFVIWYIINYFNMNYEVIG